MAPVAAYLSGPHRVLAHYFSRLPLSIDNRPADSDYYATEYLQAQGERGKWKAQGGYLRSRPVPVPQGSSEGYRQDNLKREVSLALSRGIGGFTFDVLAYEDLRSGGYLNELLSAAASVDPGFAVVLMPDMASLGTDMEVFKKVVRRAALYPGLFRTADGRLLVAPFLAERVDRASWARALADLEADGVQVAFAPTFLSFDKPRVEAYADMATGFGTFATPVVIEAEGIRAGTLASHALGKQYMAGIPTQGYRPKDALYWESHGSEAFRESWKAAITAGADTVQLTTWNDYSESTQLAPYTDAGDGVGTGFFDLNAYFATWFVTGTAPEIRRDAVYYFYRRQRVGEAGPKDAAPVRNAVPGLPGVDRIDVVVMLTQPATLEVGTSAGIASFAAPAGLSSYTVPLAEGRPVFTLRRSGWSATLTGATQVLRPEQFAGGHDDLTYWSGGGVVGGQCNGSPN